MQRYCLCVCGGGGGGGSHSAARSEVKDHKHSNSELLAGVCSILSYRPIHNQSRNQSQTVPTTQLCVTPCFKMDICFDKHVILHMLLRSHAAISSNTGGKGAILTIGVT